MVYYVISKKGKPLMPTTKYYKVRTLLKRGRARIVCREPFIIQLLF